jgi:hypothetical protein
VGRQRVGLKFHWETEGAGKDYSFKDKDSGEKKEGKTKGYTIPTEYLGGQASSNGHVEDFDLNTLGLSVPTVAELSRLAEAAETPGEFSSKALTYILTLTDPVEKDTSTKALAKAPQIYEALRS